MSTEEIMSDIYDLSMTDIEGNTVELSRFRNQVLLIVNLASQ
jgi:glutathione peroxidase-family protein